MRKSVQRIALAIVIAMGGAQAIAMAQAPSAPPKPGPEQKRLAYFVGKWTAEGTMAASPMGPGGKITSTDDCQWFSGGFAVVCHMDGKTPMGPSKGLSIMSYSPEEKVYTYYGVDNSNMAMTTVPRGSVEGDTWTYTDESVMGGQKIKTRVLVKELSPTSYSFKMEMQSPDGTWNTLMESKSTKAAKSGT